MQQYLEVCKAVTTHGVVGEVKVELWCDDAAFLGRFKRLYRGPQGQAPIAVTKVRAHKNMALVTFEGVNGLRRDRPGQPSRCPGHLHRFLPGRLHRPVPGGQALPGEDLH